MRRIRWFREAMRNMRLIIIGGDVRNLCLAELARAHGHDVALIGHGESDLPPGGEYDAALVSEFESYDDLKAYDGHPEHLKVRQFIRSIAVTRAAVDYEF